MKKIKKIAFCSLAAIIIGVAAWNVSIVMNNKVKMSQYEINII